MTEVLDYLISLISTQFTSVAINIGSMPTHEGVSIYPASGRVESYQTKSHNAVMQFALNAKCKKQKDAIQTLENIHRFLTIKRGYTDTTSFQVYSITTNTTPTYAGQEGNEWYLYGSSIEVKVFYKEMI